MRNPNDRGKYLQLQFTVEEKGVAWTATINSCKRRQRPTAARVGQVCAEDIRRYPFKDADVPLAGKTDFCWVGIQWESWSARNGPKRLPQLSRSDHGWKNE